MMSHECAGTLNVRRSTFNVQLALRLDCGLPRCEMSGLTSQDGN